MISTLIVMVFFILAITLSYYIGYDREMGGSYECGFNPVFGAHMPYSVRFFKIAVVFLLFDVELVLLMPMVFYFNFGWYLSGSMICLVFMFILLGGLLYEWKQGLLEWII
uniref:NADH-ubiquinone oxidoreductase chain 3 n=1 Tax=Echinoderes svetlanae TaxID=1912903 RepID=A0A1I9VTU9_9BILA|nr:NADH dehydrogenase subunit 3 [Echinoderes svetlanae]APA17422.1 NADH dehydrogenase subunit 3 [Echinoderes svetlanae]